MNIEDLVLDSGVYDPIWNMDVKLISKYVDKNSLLYSSMDYNATYEIQNNVEHVKLHGYRENDTSIM